MKEHLNEAKSKILIKSVIEVNIYYSGGSTGDTRLKSRIKVSFIFYLNEIDGQKVTQHIPT
jgi:hypothetical protein